MNAAEILAELPQLSGAERRAVRERMWELERERQELEFAAAADIAFQQLDRMEEADAPTAAG